MAPVKGLWTCMMCHFCSTVLFPVMELYLFDWMFKCTFTFLHKHNFNHLYSVYRKMVLATLLQCCWPFSGRSSIIIFIAMCLERMNFQEHHLCIFQALWSQLALYLHLHSVIQCNEHFAIWSNTLHCTVCVFWYALAQSFNNVICPRLFWLDSQQLITVWL